MSCSFQLSFLYHLLCIPTATQVSTTLLAINVITARLSFQPNLSLITSVVLTQLFAFWILFLFSGIPKGQNVLLTYFIKWKPWYKRENKTKQGLTKQNPMPNGLKLSVNPIFCRKTQVTSKQGNNMDLFKATMDSSHGVTGP